jgi:hypothetical protein
MKKRVEVAHFRTHSNAERAIFRLSLLLREHTAEEKETHSERQLLHCVSRRRRALGDLAAVSSFAMVI